MEKYVLIDGNNLMFRSYYATMYSGSSMSTVDGIKTNAVFAFINMINKIVKEENSNKLLIAFDKGKTFRHEEFDFYKDGRSATPDDLKIQFKIIKEILPAMGICSYEIDNYEADDIIGTFSKIISANNDEAIIISSDKDLLQLIDENVSVKLLKQNGHILYTKDNFIEDYGFEPIYMIDLKAIAGDPSDNIKGVKGIGDKGAAKLVAKYLTLENIYENLDELTLSIKNKLEIDRENAFTSKKIVTIYNEVPCEISISDLDISEIDYPKLSALYKKYELNTFLKNLDYQDEAQKETIIGDSNYKLERDSAFYVESYGTNYHTSKCIGVFIANENEQTFLKMNTFIELFDKLKPFLKYTYDIKRANVLLSKYDCYIENAEDVSLIAYLLGYNLKTDISGISSIFGYIIDPQETITKKYKTFDEVIIDEILDNGSKKVNLINDIYPNLMENLSNENLLKIYKDIEYPLAHVLTKMEIEGILIDVEQLDILQKEITEKVESLTKIIWDMVGFEFNISSPKQLGNILFETLEIEYPKKKKDNYVTDKETLLLVVDKHPIINLILEYRLYTKLQSSYANSFKTHILEDGKIHTTYNQVQTKTGRLSSNEPNLQTIPIRSTQGKEFRKVFISSKGNQLISVDYSQIELRIFAHMANEEALIEAFKNNEDIHSSTASKIYDVPLDGVTKEMRSNAKAVNFGILYGISDFGLARDLQIPVYKAKEFIEKYFETFPRIKTYMQEVIADAYKTMTVETLYGRKRKIDELNNPNYMIRSMGERMALNTPIQGTSADIIKCAMISIDEEFRKQNLKSKMILQIHDELVFDCAEDEVEIVKTIIAKEMTGVIELSVPLDVEIAIGNNLLEAK